MLQNEPYDFRKLRIGKTENDLKCEFSKAPVGFCLNKYPLSLVFPSDACTCATTCTSTNITASFHREKYKHKHKHQDRNVSFSCMCLPFCLPSPSMPCTREAQYKHKEIYNAWPVVVSVQLRHIGRVENGAF